MSIESEAGDLIRRHGVRAFAVAAIRGICEATEPEREHLEIAGMLRQGALIIETKVEDESLG